MGKEGLTLVGGVEKSNLSSGLSQAAGDGFTDKAKPDSPTLKCSLVEQVANQLKFLLKAIDNALVPLAPLLQSMNGVPDKSPVLKGYISNTDTPGANAPLKGQTPSSDQDDPLLTAEAVEDCLKLQQAINDLDEAAKRGVLAADVYKVYDPKPDGSPARPLPAGITRISDDPQQLSKLFKGRLTDEQIKNLTHPDNSSYRATIYQDQNGKTFLVFRGTENKEGLKDWKENGLQGSGLKSEHYEKAKELADILADTVGAENLEIIGHSKGGGMAAAAGIMTGAKTTTFNAAGVHPNTVPGKNVTSDAQHINSYVVDGEILNWIQDNRELIQLGATAGMFYGGGPLPGIVTGVVLKDAIPPSVGNRTALPGEPPSSVMDRVTLHGMDKVLDGIQQRKDDLMQQFKDRGCDTLL